MKKEVAVVGIGAIPVGEHWKLSLRNMFADAAWRTLDDAGTDKVDALYVGNMASGSFVNQENLGALLADYAGLGNIAASKIEAACGSGGAALMHGYAAVASGLHDVVMVGGVEKMFDTDTGKTTAILAQAADTEYETFHGASFVGLNALLARSYRETFGVSDEDMALFPVHAHKYGKHTDHATYKFEINIEKVVRSQVIADPLRLFECSAIADGAVAILLAPMERAKEFTDNPIRFTGVGQAVDTIGYHDRKDKLGFVASRIAAKRALSMAGVTRGEGNVMEGHDALSLLGFLAL